MENRHFLKALNEIMNLEYFTRVQNVLMCIKIVLSESMSPSLNRVPRSKFDDFAFKKDVEKPDKAKSKICFQLLSYTVKRNYKLTQTWCLV